MTTLYMLLSLLSFVLLALYCLLILMQGVVLIFSKSKFTNRKRTISLSIIIPFRNEISRIHSVINSLNKMDFSEHNIEIIFVDDHSDDDTSKWISKKIDKEHRILTSTSNGKKKALSLGISQSKYDLIATLDADIQLHQNWIGEVLNVFADDSMKMLILPVLIQEEKTIAGWFESLDILALTGTTVAWALVQNPIICNGANLVFKKSVYNEFVNEAVGDSFASGDDIFFMHYVKKNHPKNIGVLWNEFVIARTAAFNNFRELINQRVRWTSKSMHYKDHTTTLVAWIVLLTFVMIWGLGTRAIFSPSFAKEFVLVFTIKALTDFIFLIIVAYKFKKTRALWFYPLSIFIQLLFVPIVFFKSQFGDFKWRGRRYRK